MLLGGRAGDLYGRKRMFLIGLALFTLASLGGGLAQAEWQLLARAGRAGAGRGGARALDADDPDVGRAGGAGTRAGHSDLDRGRRGAAARRAGSSADCWSMGCPGAGCC